MSHDAERDAAAYLGGTMRARQRQRFEDHLMECEGCWREVNDARIGRGLAEGARELAPQGLREMVRAAVAAAPPRRRRVGLPVAGASLAAVVLGMALVVVNIGGQPEAIARAVADFHDARMPSETPTRAAAPDLEALALTLTASSAGHLDGLEVEAFSYRDATGHRLLLYLSDEEFPVADGARRLVAGGPWRATVGDIELLCSDRPHGLLAVSDDEMMLRAVARHLRIADLPA